MKRFVPLAGAFSFVSLALGAPAVSHAQTKPAARPASKAETPPPLKDLENSIRAHLGFLASDALAGRGSGTRDEQIACEYVAAQFRLMGIEPAGDPDASGTAGYLQKVAIAERRFTGSPGIGFTTNGSATRLVHGKEALILRLSSAKLEGLLQQAAGDTKPKPGAIVLAAVKAENMQELQQQVRPLLAGGARVVLVEELPFLRAMWDSEGRETPILPPSNPRRPEQGIVVVSADAARTLRALPESTPITVGGDVQDTTRFTYNVLGVLPGSNTASKQAVLFSSHIDHLGERPATNGTNDTIYNGADDDASGTVAVLELARALSRGPQPKRTVYFACFGSEEAGGYGAAEFLKRPPTPLTNFVCNLEFEMIGRPDAKVGADELWLTGYERSNLGPELKKQGAKIVADPHPEQNFFFRSDNIQLARKGVVAQTVSSFGLHPQYHQLDDDLAHIDFAHMTRAIASLLKPARFLVDSDFVPTWAEGKRP